MKTTPPVLRNGSGSRSPPAVTRSAAAARNSDLNGFVAHRFFDHLFRHHRSWFADEVYETLRAHGAALCVADTGEEPAAPLVATTDWGYLRLRREDFSDQELVEVVDFARSSEGGLDREPIIEIRRQNDQIWVLCGVCEGMLSGMGEMISCERVDGVVSVVSRGTWVY